MSRAAFFDAVAERVAATRAELAALAEAAERPTPELVAVTKGFGPDAVIAAARAGVAAVGESYSQELEKKWPAVVAELGADVPTVHFIGGLQRNKVRKIAEIVSVWQSIDRSSVAVEVAKRRPGAQVMLQLNVSAADSQGGCPVDEAPALLDLCRGVELDVIGTMAIGAQGDPSTVDASFRRLVQFADEHGLAHRSIGMSGDLDAAVAAGSTMVRIGTALFGPRPIRG